MRTFAFATCLALLAPTLAHAEEQPTEMKNKPLFIAGIVTAGVGVSAMSVGGVIMALGAMIKQPQPDILCIQPCPRFDPGPPPAVIMGGVILGIGAAATLAAVPMIAIGGKRVPLDMQPSGPSGSAGMTLRLTF